MLSLEESLEGIEDDEQLEVTPEALRLRERILSQVESNQQSREEA